METDRETLVRIVRELQGVSDSAAIDTAAFDHLYAAIRSINSVVEELPISAENRNLSQAWSAA